MRWRAHLWAGLVALGMIALFGLLSRFPPGASAFYPSCPFRALTGLLCPGCGATHAAAALVGGNLREASRANLLVTLLLPLGFGYGLAAYTRAVRGVSPAAPYLPRAAVASLWIATLGFGLVRNL